MEQGPLRPSWSSMSLLGRQGPKFTSHSTTGPALWAQAEPFFLEDTSEAPAFWDFPIFFPSLLVVFVCSFLSLVARFQKLPWCFQKAFPKPVPGQFNLWLLICENQ